MSEEIGAANPAAVAYEAYRTTRQGVGSKYMLSWQYLSGAEKVAWWNVVRAIKGQPLIKTKVDADE